MSDVIGIDLTPPIASMNCGMVNAMLRLLRGIYPVIPDTMKVVLFVNRTSYPKYKDCIKGQIEHSFISPEKYCAIVQKIDVLHSPFNEIFNHIDNCFHLLTKYDLTPLHFKEHNSPDLEQNIIASCRSADHILTSSSYVKNDIVNVTDVEPESITVNYLCYGKINSNQSNRNFKLKQPYIFYPAACKPHKNHKALIQAMKHVKDDTSLVLTTGESDGGERFEELVYLADKLELNNKIIVLGHVQEDMLHNIYSNAEALVFPSISEGFGYPIIEAMQRNIPIACSYASCIPEIAGNAAIYFDPHNPKDIGLKVCKLLTSPDLRAQLICNGVKQLENFAPNKVGNQLVGLYRGAAHRSKRKRVLDKRRKFKSRLVNEHIIKELAVTNGGKHSHDLKFLLLLDCSRLFNGNAYSGINKYVRMLLELFSETQSIDLIPFYDANSRGYKGEQTQKSLIYRIGNKVIDVMPKTKALQLADLHGGTVVYHSPYHPLPANRNNDYVYCLTVFDIFHLNRRDLYSQHYNLVTEDIVNSINSTEDEVLTISRYVAQELINYLNSELNTTVTYLTSFLEVSDARSQNTEHDKKIECDTINCDKRNAILVPFQDDPRKNFDFMIKVCQEYLEIEKNNIDTEIIIYGKVGKLSITHKDTLEALEKAGATVNIVDKPTDEQISVLMRNSFVFLYLSKAEGFGLPPLEAMFHLCPPIITNATSLGEIYEGWKYSVDLNTTATNIANIIEDIRLRKDTNFHSDMKKYIEKYSKDKMKKDHMAAYLSAIRRKTGREYC